MVILHAYIRYKGNIVASMPFRYNDGDDTPITARELVLDASDEDTYDLLKGRIAEILDKEKQNYGEFPNEQSSMVPCITID